MGKTLAGLLLLCVIGCGKPAPSGHPDEAAAVATIEKLGGKVEFDAQPANRRVIKVYLHSTAVKDADLAMLEKLPKLQNLFLGKTQIGDAGLEHLQALSELKTLSLNSTQVTDDGLKSLAKQQQLKTVNLQETKVTAGGANQLQKAIPDVKVAR